MVKALGITEDLSLQNLHGGSQLNITPVLGDLPLFLTSMGTKRAYGVQDIIGEQGAHTYIK